MPWYSLTERSIQSLRWIDRSDQFLKVVGSYPWEGDYVILVMYKTRKLKQPRRPTRAKTLLKNFRLLRLSNVGVTFQEEKFLMIAVSVRRKKNKIAVLCLRPP